MTSIAQPARPGRTRSRNAASTRPKSKQRLLGGGVLWIVLFAGLLAGVVAVNVAVLRLNMQIEQLGQQRLELEAKNALLESQVSSTLAPARIEREARTKLGLEPAAESTYVELRPGR